MVFNAASFTALLHALSLTQGSYKPAPAAFNIGNTSSVHSYLPVASPGAQILLKSPKEPSPLAKSSEDQCNVESYSVPPIGNQVFPPFDPEKATLYRYRQQQSVNLGSWFVHENWMTPSLFECAGGQKLSELDIASGWGSTKSAQSLLERHWDTFIKKSDFEYLASIGINTVRLPIGYWNLGPYFCQDTPFSDVAEVYENSWKRIVRAINDAGEYDIGVLVDLHGAVGSQNGQPHSGISDGESNMFTDPQNLEKTIEVLKYLMQQLVSVSNVVGIQLLNEPKNMPELPDVYSRMIESMRQVSAFSLNSIGSNLAPPNPASFPLYIHDGFDLERFDAFGSNRTDFIVQDHHSYFVFTSSDQNETASQHTSDVQGPIYKSFADASSKERRNLVIDEWSCALAPESIANEPNQDQARRDFGKGQMDVYSATAAGWSFWSYLKEDCENDLGWCFKAAIGKSLPTTFFAYENTPTDPQCIQDISSHIANMTVPSASDILNGQANNATGDASPTKSPHGRRLESLWKGSSRSQDRFDAILRRHQQDGDLTPAQRSTIKGYTDGFLTATKFASCGRFAKLGFIGQYVADNMPKGIESGTEQNYRDGFGQGLMAGQRSVEVALSRRH